MNGKPTAAQERFHGWCREQGCIIDETENPSIHHIRGAKMKLKGVKGAGEWYVIPVSYRWHQDGNNKSAIHVNKASFKKSVGCSEKDLWLLLMIVYFAEFGKYPMKREEYQIIVERA